MILHRNKYCYLDFEDKKLCCFSFVCECSVWPMESPWEGELSLSVCPGVGNRLPNKEKMANPRGYAQGGGGMVTGGIAQFRYNNIQLQTKDFSTRRQGINYRVCGVYYLEPCGDVCCFKLNRGVHNVSCIMGNQGKMVRNSKVYMEIQS